MKDDYQIVEMPNDGNSIWIGMDDFILKTHNSKQHIIIKYLGEPPHGDSYHKLTINNIECPGFAWGCNFAINRGCNFLALSWMEKLYDRKTIIIDIDNMMYGVLGSYVYDFKFEKEYLVELEKEYEDFTNTKIKAKSVKELKRYIINEVKWKRIN